MVNQYKKQLEGMMQHELSRVDFLKFLGVAFLGLVGISGLMRNLTDLSHLRSNKKVPSPGGYGRNAYGR